ncbi:hypothetical protein RM553_01310 [Zunongwangia sp. F363]|uniref:Glycine dehydrogenase n=1 Tax=Autumnicola tepida TaxID=3075595 RepID=A0ABU3C5L0_9FLAO|nr:hypothetical protein [Zunongwangia sp. F363]MDT0641457.1 hypothetical protein [Zunongwangia sp. F363]
MMFRNFFFLIDCSKAENCCDKAQYKELSRANKIKLLMHLAVCRRCKQYTARNTQLTRLIKKSNLKTCNKVDKELWKERIREELAKKDL